MHRSTGDVMGIADFYKQQQSGVMVSFHLLHRGLSYFTLIGSLFLPLLKIGMDTYYYELNIGNSCKGTIFGNICTDPFGNDWNMFSELGCANILFLLAILLISLHTLMTVHAIVYRPKKDPEWLVGSEDGCCGLLAVSVSFFAVDEPPVKAKSVGARRRILSRILTLGLQIPILVIICSSLHIIGQPSAWQSQKTSVFVLITVLLLHLINAIENIYDGVLAIFEL